MSGVLDKGLSEVRSRDEWGVEGGGGVEWGVGWGGV